MFLAMYLPSIEKMDGNCLHAEETISCFSKLNYNYSPIKSVWQYAMSSMAKVQFLAGVRDISLLHSIQTSCGAHPASYPMGTKGSFPGDKVARV
jgi:hypothetical protein